MPKFVTIKANDGVDLNAVNRGLHWLLGQDAPIVYIYAPSKRVMENIASEMTALRPLLKKNVMIAGHIQVHLMFGHTDGALSGSKIARGSVAPILALYADPAGFAWVEARMSPNAPFCLVPQTQAEAAGWIALHNAKLI